MVKRMNVRESGQLHAGEAIIHDLEQPSQSSVANIPPLSQRSENECKKK
jgi:hypothetical protein